MTVGVYLKTFELIQRIDGGYLVPVHPPGSHEKDQHFLREGSHYHRTLPRIQLQLVFLSDTGLLPVFWTGSSGVSGTPDTNVLCSFFPTKNLPEGGFSM